MPNTPFVLKAQGSFFVGKIVETDEAFTLGRAFGSCWADKKCPISRYDSLQPL